MFSFLDVDYTCLTILFRLAGDCHSRLPFVPSYPFCSKKLNPVIFPKIDVYTITGFVNRKNKPINKDERTPMKEY